MGVGTGPPVTFNFVLPDGSRKEVTVPGGTNILEAAHMNGVALEGACEAGLACSTCHVILSEKAFDSIPEATEEEDDLLDLAPGLTTTSRMGCCLIADEELQGEDIKLPPNSLNFYVDGHVPEPH